MTVSSRRAEGGIDADIAAPHLHLVAGTAQRMGAAHGGMVAHMAADMKLRGGRAFTQDADFVGAEHGRCKE